MLQPHYASQGLREIYVGFDSPDAALGGIYAKNVIDGTIDSPNIIK